MFNVWLRGIVGTFDLTLDRSALQAFQTIRGPLTQAFGLGCANFWAVGPEDISLSSLN